MFFESIRGKKDAPFLGLSIFLCTGDITDHPLILLGDRIKTDCLNRQKKSLAKTQRNKTHPAAKKLGVDEFMLFLEGGSGLEYSP